MTVRRQVIEYVRMNPGTTSTAAAKGLNMESAVVSSILTKLCDGPLYRLSGIGPRGGYGYYVKVEP